MTLSRRYDPTDHDFMLYNRWKRGLDDYEISADFMRIGLNFPSHIIRAARRRLNLPPNKRPETHARWDDFGHQPKDRPNPVAVAKTWLGTRLVEKNGSYFLDNVPTNLTRMMQATNLLRMQAGAEQLVDNPLWAV